MIKLSTQKKLYYRDFCVAGTRYYHAAKDVAEGDNVYLVPEPTNEHDPDAIMVLNMQEQKLGYVPRNYTNMFLPYLNQGTQYKATVSKILYESVPLILVEFFEMPSAE